MLAAARDTTFSSHMRHWARRRPPSGSKAYLYFFTHTPPHPRANELKAFHAGEIPYVFNVVPSSDPREAGFAYADVDGTLADAMSDYWVNFVTSGDPNGTGLPKWTAYDARDRAVSGIRRDDHRGTHLLKRQLDFLDEGARATAVTSRSVVTGS